VALRAGRRLVARLAAAPAPAPRPLALAADAAYLVTGGTGALGLTVARALVAAGARHLVLTSRRGAQSLSASAAAELAALRAAGAEVEVAAVDVSDGAAVARLLARQPRRLAGIVHAAGVLKDGLVAGQRWDAFAEVLTPKVVGALQLLAHAPALDFFVSFSSVAGWLGTPGQGNYAAANAFLDGLAAGRANMLSLAWGAWAERGMAAAVDERLRRQALERGMLAIVPDEGAALFTALTASARGALAVLPVHWGLYARRVERVPTLLTGLSAAPPATEAVARGELRRLVDAAPEKRRRALVLEHLQEGLAAALLHDGAPAAIDPQRGLAELGLDSLMALELRRSLEVALDLALPATLLLDYPTLAAVADFLVGELHPIASEPAPLEPALALLPPTLPASAASEDEARAAEIADLDEAEVIARIARKYDQWIN
jgi:acyl carrier protein